MHPSSYDQDTRLLGIKNKDKHTWVYKGALRNTDIMPVIDAFSQTAKKDKYCRLVIIGKGTPEDLEEMDCYIKFCPFRNRIIYRPE